MPQRPLPPEIYRRRRFLALGVLAVVVWLLTVAISGIANLAGGGSKNTAAPAPSDSTAAVAGGACAPGVVAVTAHVGTAAGVDQNSFGAKDKPSIWYELTNTGTADCKFQYVGAASYLTITSGAETIWTNKDCAAFTTNAVDQTVDLPAGQAQRTPAIEWSRNRSSASTGCTVQGNALAAAGAYHLVATVSNIHSADVQFLLN